LILSCEGLIRTELRLSPKTLQPDLEMMTVDAPFNGRRNRVLTFRGDFLPLRESTNSNGTPGGVRVRHDNEGRSKSIMLSWALTFLIIALLSGLLGFGFTGIAGTAMWMAKVLFLVFLALFFLTLVFGRKGA
jgi:uncharacterized membrane protein YtjA (UPF0391 family)